MPYVRVTYAQATFVQQYILCAWSNFYQTFCTHFFGGKHFFWPKFLLHPNFFKPKVFWIQIFLEPIYFWTQIFLTKFYETQNFGRPFFIFFFWTKNFWDPKFFWPKILLDPIFFTPKMFLTPFFLTHQISLDQIIFWLKIVLPKILLNKNFEPQLNSLNFNSN